MDKWGKPRCRFFHKNGNKNLEIFFYHRSYIYENTLFQLQFFNDQLFFAGIEVGKGLTNEENKNADKFFASIYYRHIFEI
jgi:hypothetical protein